MYNSLVMLRDLVTPFKNTVHHIIYIIYIYILIQDYIMLVLIYLISYIGYKL